MNSQRKLLNIGCGSKFHKDWTNIDIAPNQDHIMQVNILSDFPFTDETFDVIYHSQVLEHIERNNVKAFMSECFRVLKRNGILRIVVPNLEEIVREYLLQLQLNIDQPSEYNEANYDWMMLELYDQVVRTSSGGKMGEMLSKSELINEQYIIDRVGHLAEVHRSSIKKNSMDETVNNVSIKKSLIGIVKKFASYLFNYIYGGNLRIANFRSKGEIHMWMYDRFSVARLLRQSGFVDIKIMDAFSSNIHDWNKYELDVKNGKIYDPKSLFIEGIKP